MKRYFDQEISKESIEKMIVCFAPVIKDYAAEDTVLRYSDQREKIGVLLSGSAKLHYIDENGDTGLLETYKENDLLGDVFALPISNYDYIVTADTPCRVMYIDYHHIITPCEKSCAHHSMLINNLFIMTAQKSQELALHINILNQRTTKKKLMAFLKYASSIASQSHAVDSYGTGSAPQDSSPRAFEIPMTLGALAEYLCVDRSALMREIKSLNEEGVIKSERRVFQLL